MAVFNQPGVDRKKLKKPITIHSALEEFEMKDSKNYLTMNHSNENSMASLKKSESQADLNFKEDML